MSLFGKAKPLTEEELNEKKQKRNPNFANLIKNIKSPDESSQTWTDRSTIYQSKMLNEPLLPTKQAPKLVFDKKMGFEKQNELIETIYKPTREIMSGLLNTSKDTLESFQTNFDVYIRESTTKKEEEYDNERHFFKGIKLNNSNIDEIKKRQAALLMVDLALEHTDTIENNNGFKNKNELLNKISRIIISLQLYSIDELEFIKQDLTNRLLTTKNRNIRDVMNFDSSTIKSVRDETKQIENIDIKEYLNGKIENRNGYSWSLKRSQANKEIEELNFILDKLKYENKCVEELRTREGINVEETTCISLLGIVDLVRPYEGRTLLGGKRTKKRRTNKRTKKRRSTKKRRKTRRQKYKK